MKVFSRVPAPLLPAVLALLAGAPAFAQSANYTSVETVAGVSTRIGYSASAAKNCAPAPLPTIRVIKPPKHGVLSIRTGAVITNQVANCPNLKTPAQVMFYQGGADYQGADELAYEVTSANGEVGVYNISITVKEAPKPAPPTAGEKL
jgi:hypothetical protein